MRTTKVKRLGPVMALALVFALAAVVGVSLWHSGPEGGLTPPAAEAQSRDVTPAVTPDADSCQVNLGSPGGDVQCITSEDTIEVVVYKGDAGALAGVAVYATGASASDSGADRKIPGIQAAVGDPAENRGKKGVGLFLVGAIPASQSVTTDALGRTSGVPADQMISVSRSWAATGTGADAGNVWVYVYTGAATDDDVPTRTATGSLDETATNDGNVGASTLVQVVQVHFTQPLAENFDGTISGLATGDAGTLPAKAVVERGAANNATPEPRRFPITAGDDTVTFTVSTADKSSTGSDAFPALGGQIRVAREFTAGSALKSGVAMTAPGDRMPATALDPSIHEAVETDGTVTGWADDGAVEVEVTVTHISSDGNETVFDPFWLYRAGPVASIEFSGNRAEPTDPHRVTDSGTEYSPFGKLDIHDALGSDAMGATHVIYEGANADAVAILPEDEGDRMIPIADARAGGFGIDIEEDAPSGDYDVNFVVKDSDGMVLATLSSNIEVIGAPDAMDGEVAENVVNPGGMLELQNVALNSGSQSAYATPCNLTALATTAMHTDTTSICAWTGKTAADRAVLTGGSGKVKTDGTQSIMVKSDAAPGTYTIVLSDGRQGQSATSMVADKEITFAVRGQPANYDLTGPTVGGSVVNRLGRGQIGSFTVTATDVNGNTPYFRGDATAADVFVVVSGDTGSVQTLRVVDGKVTLNQMGMASFQVLVNDNAPSGSIRVTAVGLGDGVDSQMVSIGPVAPPVLGAPTGLRLMSPNDDTGTVRLTWTAGANSTQHWIAGIKKSDLDAGNVSVGANGTVLWTAASSQTGHTFTGLTAGEVYLFTVAAGNAANEWSAWVLPVQSVTVGRPASGSGPGIPFSGAGGGS